MKWSTMRGWVNREKRRYYRAQLLNDLLGDWVVISRWGSLDSDRGGSMMALVDSEAEGERKIDEIDKRRRQRGYEPVVPC